MKKRVVLLISLVMIGVISNSIGVIAMDFGSKMPLAEYIKRVVSDEERFRYRNTLTITEINFRENRMTLLFDAEYLLKMDKNKQYMPGGTAKNGVKSLTLGWANDETKMEKEALLGHAGPQIVYIYPNLVFRREMDDDFWLPDMVETEIPEKMIMNRLASNIYKRLYYSLEAYGFWTEGFVEYPECPGAVWERCSQIVSAGSRENYAVTEVEAEPLSEPEPSPEVEDVPELEPVIEKGTEPVIEVEPEPEPVAETEPEPEPVDIEPEPVPMIAAEPEPAIEEEPGLMIELRPEPVIWDEPEPVAETEPEPEPAVDERVIEVELPTVRHVEPKNELTAELVAVAVVSKIINRGDGGAKMGALKEPTVIKREITPIKAPNTGYKKQGTEWEFLTWPLAGGALLGVWWFWPRKKLKKVKNSQKKVLTFFLRRDKMVTV